MKARARRTLTEELGIAIKETQSVLHQRMDEALRPLALSVPQYVCLQALYDSPGITGSELARRTFVSRQSMNVLLQGLERRGLVERSGEPGPRRERAVDLTDDAGALVTRGRAAVATVVDAMTARLSVSQQRSLIGLLIGCRDALRAP